MISAGMILEQESYKILGACFEVYKEEGNGFLEAVYQECLSMELSEREIPFIEHPELKLQYKQKPLKQIYKPDFLCFGQVIVELKSVKTLLDEHRAQIINYLRATGHSPGLLINFGHYPRIEHERFVNTFENQ